MRSRVSTIAGIALASGLLACADDAPAAGPPSTAGTLSVYQADLFYQKIGTGEPVVVVHGGPGLDHGYLRDGLAPLADTHQVVFYDQRGLGGSNAVLDAASISMGRYLTDLDRIRERVAERDQITLLAHSWGAIPALLYTLDAPERVKRLILVNPVEPGSRFREQTDANQAAARDSTDAAAIDSIARTPAFAAREPEAISRVFFHVFRGTFADPQVADRTLKIQLQARTARQGSEVATLLMAPLQGLDFWDQLETVVVPTLIIHGEGDPIPVDMVEALDAALPDSRLVVLENAGHFPFLETPTRFFETLRDFLGSATAAP